MSQPPTSWSACLYRAFLATAKLLVFVGVGLFFCLVIHRAVHTPSPLDKIAFLICFSIMFSSIWMCYEYKDRLKWLKSDYDGALNSLRDYVKKLAAIMEIPHPSPTCMPHFSTKNPLLRLANLAGGTFMKSEMLLTKEFAGKKAFAQEVAIVDLAWINVYCEISGLRLRITHDRAHLWDVAIARIWKGVSFGLLNCLEEKLEFSDEEIAYDIVPAFEAGKELGKAFKRYIEVYLKAVDEAAEAVAYEYLDLGSNDLFEKLFLLYQECPDVAPAVVKKLQETRDGGLQVFDRLNIFAEPKPTT